MGDEKAACESRGMGGSARGCPWHDDAGDPDPDSLPLLDLCNCHFPTSEALPKPINPYKWPFTLSEHRGRQRGHPVAPLQHWSKAFDAHCIYTRRYG